tara:strand:- start:2451 stop:2720 length:270 start_codon:yes stop_codon:yes gene_type:complete
VIDEDWFDELLDGEPSGITDTQWLIIEGNIDSTSLSDSIKSSILNRLNDLTELEAEEIITLINENKYEKDPKKQWQEMFRRGVFGHTSF